MSFFTDFTPLTLRVTSMALLSAAQEITKPFKSVFGDHLHASQLTQYS